jgi:O-antigen ligase
MHMNQAVERRQSAPQFVVLILVASSFFENYLNKGIGLFSPAKALGALAVAVWGFAWLLRRCSVILTRQMLLLVGFGLAILVSFTVTINRTAAVQTSVRYLSFFLLFFIVVQAIAGDPAKAVRIVDAAVIGASLSAVVGLLIFLSNGSRARGPLDDPNDFGFMLATAIPLVVYRMRTLTSPRLKFLTGAGLIAIVACAAATFSRGAAVGLAVTLVWLTATRRLRLRWVLATLAVAGIAGLVVLRLNIPLIKTALAQKQYIAGDNISSRITAWDITYHEWRLSPFVGIGVGNYLDRYWEFSALPTSGTTHNAYLHVMAETGIFGLTFFLLFLAQGWLHLRQRPDGIDDDVGVLRNHLAASFLTALVASLFLTEQFYSPLWLFPAIGAGLAVVRVTPKERRPVPATLVPEPTA